MLAAVRPRLAALLGVAALAESLVARLLRRRAALNRALRDQAAMLERQRTVAADRAVNDERTRIAGELHDVVAHALSGMTVQATGARRLTLTRADLAREAFEAIETAGREALDELRRLLGVLRRDDTDTMLTPQPSLRHVGSLIRRAGAAGLPASVRVEGEERELAPGVDGTAYRVIQDALRAARDHGCAGRAEVRLRYRPATLDVEIRDDGATLAPRPLMGTRERVVLHGGRLSSDPRRGGGHVVRATLPLDGEPLPAGEPATPEPCAAERTRRRVRLPRPRRLGPAADSLVAALFAVVVVAGMSALVLTMPDRGVLDFLFPALIGAMAWLAGRVVRSRTRLTVELHEAAARLEEAGEEERRIAVADERRRIARELHDLVAHSISVMVVQAGGARRILDKDPARALEAAARIERTGREALSEMRHLLGMLGTPDAPRAPQPTLAEVGALVASARAAGLPAMLEIRGERRPLPPGLDLAAYRIIQEALTNAIKHAPGSPTTVTVEWGTGDLSLDVRDHGQGAAPSGGHGLVGMRERVRLYGGELTAGPAEGGWCVHARLPLAVGELTFA